MITIHGSGVTVQLPSRSDFQAPIKRQISELIAMDGSVIRQVSAFQQSAKRLAYTGSSRESSACLLRDMVELSPFVVVAPGDGRVYTATINELTTTAVDETGGSMVPISFVCLITEVIV